MAERTSFGHEYAENKKVGGELPIGVTVRQVSGQTTGKIEGGILGKMPSRI